MATTQPSLSATTNNSRFDEMEAEIKRNQAEFASINTRFDQVEDQAIRTLAVCQASSTSILDLRKDTSQQLKALRNATTQQILDLRNGSAQAIQLMRDEATANQHNLQMQL